MELNLLNLLLVLLAAWVSGTLASRLGYPSVLGELLAGIVLGPPLLGLLHGSEALAVLAEIGVLLMMLYIGMEIDPRELGKASWPGLLAALGGFITPFVAGYFVVLGFGGSHLAGLFVGIAAGVTSLATKSRILFDLKLLDTRLAHVMMAGALVSDTLALVAFAAILGVVEVGSLELASIGMVVLKVLLFFGITALIGLKAFPYLGRRLTESALGNRTFHFTLVLLIAVFFGELAELAGLHAILGAFLAGLFLRDNVLGRTLAHDLMTAVREASIGFLAPIFFVTAGFAVSFGIFQTNLGLFLAIMAVAILGKILGTVLFYLPTGYGWREGLAVGMGMNGRGAVEIIVAGIGLQMGLISQEIFSILVFMAIFTTATVPLLLKWGTDWLRRRGELVRSGEARRGALIVGAGPLARTLARVLSRTHPVWLVDSNPEQCALAESEGLTVIQGNALQEQVLSEAQAAHAGSFLAMTGNAEVNTLAAQLARNVFQVPEIYVLQVGHEGSGQRSAAKHLTTTALFAGPVRQAEWEHGLILDEMEQTKVALRALRARTPLTLFDEVQEQHHLPLAIKRGDEYLPFHAESALEEEDELILLRPKPKEERAQVPLDRFDHLAAHSPVLDLHQSMRLETFFERAAVTLADQSGINPEELTASLLTKEISATTVVAPGLAVSHALIEGQGRFHLLIARCRDGIYFPGQEERVHAIFLLLRSPDERAFHLRALSAIAQIVQDPSFEQEWLMAWGPDALRRIVLEADRRRYPELEAAPT